MAIKVLLFDAANTLIHKPSVFDNIREVLKANNLLVEENKLKYNHKLISELIEFPDVTSKDFYEYFNKNFLLSLGIEPTTTLLDDIFSACTYQPWKAFNDVTVLRDIAIPKNIISNFNNGLESVIQKTCGNDLFSEVLISERENCRKPDLSFYQIAIDRLDVAPHEILYIGDSLKLDIIPAKQLGITAYLIDRDHVYPSFENRISNLNEINTLL